MYSQRSFTLRTVGKIPTSFH